MKTQLGTLQQSIGTIQISQITAKQNQGQDLQGLQDPKLSKIRKSYRAYKILNKAKIRKIYKSYRIIHRFQEYQRNTRFQD